MLRLCSAPSWCGCCTGLGEQSQDRRSGTWVDELSLSTQREVGTLPVGLFLLYVQPILLVNQNLTRRSAPRQLLRRRHRLGFRPVHAGGSLGPFSFHLPPLLWVGPHEVGLHLALSAQRPPLGLQTLISGRSPGRFTQ